MASSTPYNFNAQFITPAPTTTPRGGSTFDPVRDSVNQLATNGSAAMAAPTTTPTTTPTPDPVETASTPTWEPSSQPTPTPLGTQQGHGTPPTREQIEARRQVAHLCDSLSTVYGFSTSRRGELMRFALTLLNAVAPGDIMARCMERCTQYQILDKLDAQAKEYALLAAAIVELRSRLQNTFALTADQMKNIRVLCMQMLVQPDRVVYMELADAVFIEMQKPEVQESLGMTGALATASQRHHVMSYVRRTCSSVRNSLREDTRDGVGLGSKKNIRALAAFSVFIARKYHSGESETNLVADTRAKFAIKLALLRAFAVDNANLLCSGEDEEDAEQGPEYEHPPAGRRRKTSVGRVKKGEDFWSKVEAHFAMLAKVHGGFNFSSATWDTYITSVLEKDNARIPPAQNASVSVAVPAAAGPSMAAVQPAPPAAAPAGPSETPLDDLWKLVGFQ